MDSLNASLPPSPENLASSQKPESIKKNQAHILVFTSGKGGVGKTCITTNIATAMAQKDKRVCIFDADTGLANINILLGLRPEFTLEHVLNGEKSIQDIVIKTAQGVAVIPGATGIAELAAPDSQTVDRLCNALASLEADYDYFLIDTAAGIADSVLHFIESAPYTFLLITPEPTSLTDGFSMLKLLNSRHYPGRIRVVVNMADDYAHATETYRRFAAAVDKYLDLQVDYGGFVVRDDAVTQSVMQQTPVVDIFDAAPASRCLQALADNMLKHIGNTKSETGLADYWRNFLQESVSTANAQQVSAFENIQPELVSVTTNKPDFAQLTQSLLATMQSDAVDRQAVEAFSSEFIAGFQARFGNFPNNFRLLLFRWLETENYPPAQMQDLAATLEMLYVSKHNQPLHSMESSVARLIAQCKNSEAQMGMLIKQLREAYVYAFKSDAFDARQELLNNIKKVDFTEEDYQQLLDDLNLAFQVRFKRRYQGKSDLLLAEASETLTEIANEEMQLQQQINALTENFQQLQQQHASLLKTLKQD